MTREGRIVEGRGGLYTVRGPDGDAYILRAKNKFRREGLTPLVGDKVIFLPGKGEEHGWLEEILPRSSVSLRPPVANLTQLLVTLSPEPVPDLLLADKLLVYAFDQHITPLLVINKTELDGDLAQGLEAAYAPAGVRVLSISAEQGWGLEALKEAMQGQVNCVAGQSGVGKSTLISALTGLSLETGEISSKIRRGRQTTRHTTLIEREGYMVLDTPGFSLLELPNEYEPELLRDAYPDFAPHQPDCRFEVCLHDKEPGCAVDAAARKGLVDAGRLARYRLLLNQQKEKWSKRYD